MIPIITRYGSSFLFTYTFIWGLGIVAGLGLTARLARKQQLPWLDAWLFLMGTSWLGGRLGFILVNWDYYGSRPSDIWQLWHNGLVYQAALAGGLLGLGVWCRWQKEPFYRLADLLAPALVCLTVFGWSACWFEGCAYGLETTLQPAAADLPDAFGVMAVRYQTQLAGVILSLLLMALVLWGRKRFWPGGLFWFSLLMISLNQLIITFFRGDTVPYLATMRLDTFLNALLVLISLFLLQYTRQRSKRSKRDEE